MPAIRVVLADDHALVRAGFRALLETMDGVSVIGEAEDGRAALGTVAERKPDVLIVDLSMPGMNGLEVVDRVRRKHPRVRVLVLSMHRELGYASQALSRGATGYLIKGALRSEFEVAVRAVARGDVYLSPAVAGPLLEGRGDRTTEPGPFEVLTARQREILQLLAEGHSTSLIARRLYVSVKTVESHRAGIVSRLGIRDVPGLVRDAIRWGLVPLED
jgi:DNA-binding NarL/FixJ family response regulator